MKLVVTRADGLESSEIGRLIETFPPARREQIVRIRDGRRLAESAVGEVCVRLGIAERLGLAPAEIALARGERGKPFLEGDFSLHFNLSHSGGLVVCAFGGAPVGVDVEEVRKFEFRSIAERCFTDVEREELGRADDPLPVFFRLWTARESGAKLGGGGIFAALRGGVSAGYVRSFGVTREGELADWRTSPYVLSVSCPSPIGCTAEFRSAEEILRAWTSLCSART